MCAREIESTTGLTLVQIDRRLHELKREGIIAQVVSGGVVARRHGCCVYELTAGTPVEIV